VEKYDQIIGVRVNGRGNISHLNRFGNWLITKTFNVLMGTKLSDVCSGMYLINSNVARQLELNTGVLMLRLRLRLRPQRAGGLLRFR